MIRRIYTLLLLITTSFFVLHAEDRINLGEMQLDTEYPLTSYKFYIGTFTAPRTGVLTCSATTNDVMYPYRAELDDMEAEGNPYEVTMNSLWGSRSYDFNVEEGQTYVMYASFIMNNGTVFKMTMAEKEDFALTGTSPAEGGTFHVSNGGQVVFDFDKAVTYTSAELSVGESVIPLTGSTTTGSIHFDLKSIVWNLLTEGKAHPGDTLTISLDGLALASNHEVLYQGTGQLELHLVIGSMPIVLESTEHTSGNFLSYYTTNDSTGIIKMHFSGKVSTDQLSAQLKYGMIDKDADGDYYVEYLTPTLSEDGKTVIINLQGKRRKAQDMVTSGTNYGTVVLGITGVLDEHGIYAYSSGQGSLGSYWYSFDYQEVTANVFCEFTPASGSKLTDQTQSIELWLTDDDKLVYDGVLFTYVKDRKPQRYIIPNEDLKKEADPDDNTATILTIPVPVEVLTGNNLRLSLLNLQSRDGGDYRELLTATYTTDDLTAIQEVTDSTQQEKDMHFTLDGKSASSAYRGIVISPNKHKYIIK